MSRNNINIPHCSILCAFTFPSGHSGPTFTAWTPEGECLSLVLPGVRNTNFWKGRMLFQVCPLHVPNICTVDM